MSVHKTNVAQEIVTGGINIYTYNGIFRDVKAAWG
jgi:N-acetylneuraminic acid mutarotase